MNLRNLGNQRNARTWNQNLGNRTMGTLGTLGTSGTDKLTQDPYTAFASSSIWSEPRRAFDTGQPFSASAATCAN